MRHARRDYNRIQDPAGLIPDDEPVFLLRGQDEATPGTIRDYAARAQKAGASDELTGRCWEWADEIEAWQKRNGCKVPDMPEDA